MRCRLEGQRSKAERGRKPLEKLSIWAVRGPTVDVIPELLIMYPRKSIRILSSLSRVQFVHTLGNGLDNGLLLRQYVIWEIYRCALSATIDYQRVFPATIELETWQQQSIVTTIHWEYCQSNGFAHQTD